MRVQSLILRVAMWHVQFLRWFSLELRCKPVRLEAGCGCLQLAIQCELFHGEAFSFVIESNVAFITQTSPTGTSPKSQVELRSEIVFWGPWNLIKFHVPKKTTTFPAFIWGPWNLIGSLGLIVWMLIFVGLQWVATLGPTCRKFVGKPLREVNKKDPKTKNNKKHHAGWFYT